MIQKIWEKTLGVEGPGGIRIAPALMTISGDGMGVMICSIITPVKTES